MKEIRKLVGCGLGLTCRGGGSSRMGSAALWQSCGLEEEISRFVVWGF